MFSRSPISRSVGSLDGQHSAAERRSCHPGPGIPVTSFDPTDPEMARRGWNDSAVEPRTEVGG